ncbi:MAG: glycosyltransferase family 4 protein [Pseudomonadota bacterium]
MALKVAIALRRMAADGGTGGYATALARSLLEGGHEVAVICMESALEPELEARVGRGLAMVRVRVPRLGSLVSMPAFARAARAAVVASRPDVSLALGRVPGLDVYRAGGGCHAAYLQTLPGWWASPRHHVELALDRGAVLGARRVVANARGPGEQLVARYGLDRARLVVIHNGVDAGRFRPRPELRAETRAELGLSTQARLAVFLGAGFRRKGLDLAIRALARVPGLALVALGGDRGTARYRRLAARLGVTLRLVGARPDPERYLGAADLMILPTRYDSAANAVLEGMAAGLPVITTVANGAAELLPHPWLAVDDPEDVTGLAAAVTRALGTPGLGELCRAAALEYPWSRATGAMIRSLEEVAGSPDRPRGERP